MKKVILFLVLLQSTLGVDAYEIPIYNGGFEIWENDSQNYYGEMVSGWEDVSFHSQHNLSHLSKGNPRTGNYSLEFPNAIDAIARTKGYTLGEGTYTFSVYVSCSYYGKITLRAIGVSGRTYVIQSSSYSKHSLSFTLEETKTIYFEIDNDTRPSSASHFLVDDCSLETTDGILINTEYDYTPSDNSDFIYFVYPSGEAELARCINKEISGTIEIPSTISKDGIDYKVRKIGSGAFDGCTNIKEIILPSCLTEIGKQSFKNCTSLNTIVIPNGVSTISKEAFLGCTALTSVNIPTNVSNIENEAFSGCTNLTFVTINSNAVLSKTYSASSSLKDIFGSQVTNYILGNEVTNIGSYAFYGCTELSSITIPNNISSIEKYAFWNCTGLVKVTINSNAVLSKSSYSSSLKDIFGTQVISYILGDGVMNIGSYAFYGCLGFSSITIPNSVTNIGNYSFYGCTGLTSIHIPNSVTDIGYSAFEGCSSLSSVTIGNGVSRVGNNAFKNCTSLSKVEISNLAAWCDISFGNIDSNPLYYAHNMYLNDIKVEEVIIPESVTNIGNYAFYACFSLTSVTIPNSVKIIGESAFYECIGLTSVNIPNSVTSIGDAAFYSCSELANVTINSNALLSKSYSYSKSLKDIFGSQVVNYIIGDNVTSIGSYAFDGCSGMNSITIPNSVTRFGRYTFRSCSNLSKVNISDLSAWCKVFCETYDGNPLSYAHNLYLNNELITGLVIPNDVTSIGSYSFAGCSCLNSVTINDRVKSIGTDAFGGCTGLTKVNISELGAWCNIVFSSNISNPLYYAHNLYLNDEKINDLVIPNNVTNIGAYAFYGGSGFASITIPENVGYIGSYAFDVCNTIIHVLRKNYYYSEKDCFKTNQVYGFSYLSLGETGSSFHPYDVPTVKVFSNGAKMEGVVFQNYDDVILSYEFLGIDDMTNASNYCSYSSGHTMYYLLHTAKNGDIIGLYKFYTPSINLTTKVAKIVNRGEAVIAAETNLMDNSPDAGFEWRKIDAPDVIPSKTGEAVVYDGNIEGIIKELDASSYYKFRPYYKAYNGRTFYGEWIGFDPSDFSYFEPTVHTYDHVDIVNGKATLVGYALQGSDEIISQGFEYWKNGTAHSNGASAPSSGIITVTASGQCMTAQVSGLLSNTTYGFRAFVETSKGIKYGEEYEFTMPVSDVIDPANIIVFVDPLVKSLCVSNWDTNGDGELDDSEAAVVTTLGTVFKKKDITSFNELQYFIGLQSINEGAFANCKKIQEITLPVTVETLEKDAFLYCKSLVSLHIPAKVASMGINALSGCSAMTAITVDEDNDTYCSIEGVLFTKDKKQLLQFPCAKTSEYTVPEGTEIIGRDAFYQAIVTSVILPSTLRELVYDAFGDCKQLTDMEMPEGLETIGDHIYNGCSALKTIHIPSTVTSIGQYVCKNCKSITDVYTSIENPSEINDNNFTDDVYANAILHVPAGTRSKYASIGGWKNFGIIHIDGSVVEPYLAISPDNKVVAFYYDNEKYDRPGKSFALESYEGFGPDTAAVVNNVVFDPSFADVHPVSTYKWFYGMNNLTTIEGMEYLNTSEVTTMRAMFSGCSSLNKIDLSHFDTSNVTSMRNMFNDCSSLTSLDVSLFDTSNVTDMYRMFYGCSSLTSLDVSSFNTSKVIDMYRMFYGCSNLSSLDVSHFVTTNVTTMAYMFYNCSNLVSIDVGGFNTSNVTTMEHLFSYCKKLSSLNVSGFNTSNVTSMEGMFNFCNTLETVDVSGFNTSKVKSMKYMFNECTSLKTLDLSNFDTSKVTDTGAMFDNCYSLDSLAISGSMGNLNNKACNKVGTEEVPCLISAPENFDFGVETIGSFLWKGGWFCLGNTYYSMGDANHDGIVDISDVMLTVYKSLNKAVYGFFKEEADINHDDIIDIVDVMSIVNITLGKTVVGLPAHYIEDHFTHLLIKNDNNGYSLSLEGNNHFTAIQMVVTVPESSALSNAYLNAQNTSLNLRYKFIGDNRYNLVVWSTDGSTLDNTDPLIYFQISRKKGISVSDVRFTNDAFETIILTDTNGTPTNITDITADSEGASLYNIQGIKVSEEQLKAGQLAPGVYIINGKKVVVK